MTDVYYNATQFGDRLKSAGLMYGSTQAIKNLVERGEIVPSCHDAKGFPLFSDELVSTFEADLRSGTRVGQS